MGEVVIPFKPRSLQQQVEDEAKRFNVLVCHRRWGKTVYAINKLQKTALTCALERPRVHYVAPLYSQAKKVAWDYAKHYSSTIPGRLINEAELRVDYPNGGRLQLLGADNPDSHRGIYSDGAVFDEPAQMNPRMWSEIMRPALSDRKGWAMFIGTPGGRNAFHQLYEEAGQQEDWNRWLFRASETGIIDVDELNAARRTMSEAEFEQEFECSWEAAIRGAYYGKLMADADKLGHICSVPHDPGLLVWTAWDLGMDDDTSVWFIQIAGREYRAIAHRSYSGMGFASILRDLDATGYRFAGHILPHDVQVRELGTGKSRREVLESMGLRNITIAPKLAPEDGIEAVRNLIPRMVFDEQHCKHGIESLRQYRTEYDDKRGAFKTTPLHDWTSHAADALRYFATGYREGMEDWARPIDWSDYDRTVI